jgi:hypothetical protein
MKIKIIKVYEKNGSLRVETECPYGRDNIGCSLESQYLNPLTDKPKYIDEVKSLLERKYKRELVEEKEVNKELWNTEIDTDQK